MNALELFDIRQENRRLAWENKELASKLDALMEYQGLTTRQLDEHQFEVVKVEAEEMPIGDYINPIPYKVGMTVEQGKFYTDGDDIWEAWNSGVPNGFTDKQYFDIIEV